MKTKKGKMFPGEYYSRQVYDHSHHHYHNNNNNTNINNNTNNTNNNNTTPYYDARRILLGNRSTAVKHHSYIGGESTDTLLERDWIPEHLSSDLQIYETASNGDCFFRSIQIILASVNIPVSISDLRHIVAKPVLDEKDQIVNMTMNEWLTLYQDAYKEKNKALMDEYKHLAGLEKSTLPLTWQDRQVLFYNMLHSSFWGEQHCCRIIEEQTQMRFLIFNGDMEMPQVTWYHSKDFAPKSYCLLYLHHNHYRPVSWRGQFVFDWEQLSLEMRVFFSQAYIKKS